MGKERREGPEICSSWGARARRAGGGADVNVNGHDADHVAVADHVNDHDWVQVQDNDWGPSPNGGDPPAS
jgi:hypothetical protein